MQKQVPKTACLDPAYRPFKRHEEICIVIFDEKTFDFHPYLLFILGWTADLGMHAHIVKKS
jgi:hypothetical protein